MKPYEFLRSLRRRKLSVFFFGRAIFTKSFGVFVRFTVQIHGNSFRVLFFVHFHHHWSEVRSFNRCLFAREETNECVESRARKKSTRIFSK